MDFDKVISQLKTVNTMTLPGAAAHNLVMDIGIRQNIFKDVNHKDSIKKAAVLALLYPDKNQQAKMVFILRKTYNGHHSGQISFPGGKLEVYDKSLIHTALRETHEEIGVRPGLIEIQRSLSPVFIPVSNFEVQPYLGIAFQPVNFKKDPVEVAQIIEIPFESLLNNALIPVQHTYFGKTYTLKAFQVQQIKIWGATAMILSEIVSLFK